MGLNMSRRKQKEAVHVVLMGLDMAGKSTLLYRLQRQEVMKTLPTVGFNVGMLEFDKNITLTIWDVGGQGMMRPHWKYYLEGCKAVVFVVDSSDRARMGEAKKALKKILSDENMKGVPLMVLANKTDIPNSMTIHEVSTELDLSNCTGRNWEVQACSAQTDLGVQQAFLSVVKLIKDS